jgi:hypothetical protein
MSGQKIRFFGEIGAFRDETAMRDTVEFSGSGAVGAEAKERLVFANNMPCNAMFSLATL